VDGRRSSCEIIRNLIWRELYFASQNARIILDQLLDLADNFVRVAIGDICYIALTDPHRVKIPTV
jgi:hypothetical protein